MYVTEALVGYTFFCHIDMVNTQHLLQRFLLSGVLFSKHIKYAKPASSKTQGMNVRFKIFKNVI